MIFKSTNGKWMTDRLFFERCNNPSEREYVLYTLKDEDYDMGGTILPSLKRLYVECEDPTEYSFAEKYLGGWAHWKVLRESNALVDVIDDWREELNTRLRSKGVQGMIALAKNEEASFQAIKWLAEEGWNPGNKGRPKKTKNKKEIANTSYSDDAKRLGL